MRNTTSVVRRATVKPSEEVASLDDLLTQILLKLPIKQLIGFKLVKRHWLSLVTSHEFCLMRNPSPNPVRGIFLRIKDENDNRYRYEYIPLFPKSFIHPPPFINLAFTTNPSFTTILHSCNGLLLCAIDDKIYTSNSSFHGNIDRSMYVYNPTTNLSTTLPYFAIGDQVGATLVFDPVKSRHYKVVTVVRVYLGMARVWKVYVYSSETGGWSFGAEILVQMDIKFGNGGVYWNGSVHWLTKKLTVRNPGMSLRFHVDTRMLEEMPSPPVVHDQDFTYENKNTYYFGESCDHLHFVETILPLFNVYEMKRDYSEWFVKYRVDLSVFIGDHSEMIKKGHFDGLNYYVVYVLSLVRGENDEDSKLVLRIPGKAVKVNLVDGSWEKLCDIMHNNICSSFGYNFTGEYSGMCYFSGESGLDYIQSLCSV